MRSRCLALVTLSLAIAFAAILPTTRDSVAAASPAPLSASFKLGFKTMADLIPDIAGSPLEDEHYGPNGDSLQQTTTGLMVWRKSDNWTAFTNGSRTWINGPVGLQERANEERFDWETGSATSPSPQGEINLWDRRSSPTAYIATDDDNTIYLWSGQPVAYLLGEEIYGFNGNHIGWFQKGIVWDWEGVAVGFSREAPYVAQTSEPAKAPRQPKPDRLPREAAPAMPRTTLGVYSELLGAMLRMGVR